MKKKIILIITIVIIIIGIIIGAFKISQHLENKKYNDKLSNTITENNWSREGDGDTEYIYFDKNGSFGYYCACGNGIDGYEMCDSYKYDEETQTIKLECYLPEVQNKIKIIENDEYHLVLDFAGEQRTFQTEKAYLLDNPLDFAGIKFQSVTPEGLTLEFKEDGRFEAFDTKNSGYTLSANTCFYWAYEKESDEIKLNCNGEENKIIKINKYDKDKQEIELNFTYENKTIIFKQKK